MQAGAQAELRSGELEPDEVVGVVHDPHLIRFRVTDIDLDFGALGGPLGILRSGLTHFGAQL